MLDHCREDTADQQVLKCFRSLVAQGTGVRGPKPVTVKSVGCPTATVQDQPNKELALPWHVHLPDLVCPEDVDPTMKKGGVGRSRRVYSAGRPFPDEPVRLRGETDLPQRVPNNEVLQDHLHRPSVGYVHDPTDSTRSGLQSLRDSARPCQEGRRRVTLSTRGCNAMSLRFFF
jgi:hypothetical protein